MTTAGDAGPTPWSDVLGQSFLDADLSIGVGRLLRLVHTSHASVGP